MDAERLERAAMALLDAASRMEAETMCVVPRRLVDALGAALAAQPAQAGGGDACCLFCRTELDPDEMDDGSDLPSLAPGVCSECFQRWHDEPVWRKRLKEATDKPAQAGEAVAWGYRGRDGKIHPAVDRLFAESLARALSGPHGRPDNGPWEAVPLYTHPTPRAQPAPEWAGEKCPRCACERNTRGAVSGANGRFAGACSDEFHGEAPDPDATPRAEAASAEAVAREAARTACEQIAGSPVLLTSDAVDAIVARAVAHALREVKRA